MWASKVQTTVALSSMEAEYTALTKAVKQALFMHKMFALLEIDATYPVWIYCDNQSALTIASQAQHAFHARMKHYAIKYHFIHDSINKQLIQVEYCPTDEMIANIFTKALLHAKFVKLRDKLMGN